MIRHTQKYKQSFIFRLGTFFIIFCFSLSLMAPSLGYAQTALTLPTPGTMVMPSAQFNPTVMLGMSLHPENPLEIDFIIDRGDDALEGDALKKESQKLMSYFFATMTVPEDQMWVNLSPYEENRIIADGLGDTVLGRDMLAQDYLLKQLSASIMYPEKELGKKFWSRVQQRVAKEYGSVEIPMNTFNKIWIMPDKASVYTHGTSVFVTENYLKVMLEEDYLALEQNSGSKSTGDPVTGVTNEIVREILIPEIEYEVNYGRHFAPLRQMFHSMILATWYKTNLRSSILTQYIANQNKTDGVNTEDTQAIQEIYDQYVEAFQIGVYDYIKEEKDPVSQEMIPRKYFSGGVNARLTLEQRKPTEAWLNAHGDLAMVSTRAQMQGENQDRAQLSAENREKMIDLFENDFSDAAMASEILGAQQKFFDSMNTGRSEASIRAAEGFIAELQKAEKNASQTDKATLVEIIGVVVGLAVVLTLLFRHVDEVIPNSAASKRGEERYRFSTADALELYMRRLEVSLEERRRLNEIDIDVEMTPILKGAFETLITALRTEEFSEEQFQEILKDIVLSDQDRESLQKILDYMVQNMKTRNVAGQLIKSLFSNEVDAAMVEELWGEGNTFNFDEEVWIKAGSFYYRIWVDENKNKGNYQRWNEYKSQSLGKIRSFEFGTEMVVGRVGERTSYMVSDGALSRQHFSLSVSKANSQGIHTLEVQDLNSTNGTKVEWKVPNLARESADTIQKNVTQLEESVGDFMTETIVPGGEAHQPYLGLVKVTYNVVTGEIARINRGQVRERLDYNEFHFAVQRSNGELEIIRSSNSLHVNVLKAIETYNEEIRQDREVFNQGDAAMVTLDYGLGEVFAEVYLDTMVTLEMLRDAGEEAALKELKQKVLNSSFQFSEKVRIVLEEEEIINLDGDILDDHVRKIISAAIEISGPNVQVVALVAPGTIGQDEFVEELDAAMASATAAEDGNVTFILPMTVEDLNLDRRSSRVRQENAVLAMLLQLLRNSQSAITPEELREALRVERKGKVTASGFVEFKIFINALYLQAMQEMIVSARRRTGDAAMTSLNEPMVAELSGDSMQITIDRAVWIKAGRFYYKVWGDDRGGYFQRWDERGENLLENAHPFSFGEEQTIGRSNTGTTYNFPDPTLSNRHVSLTLRNKENNAFDLELKDLNSSNGTVVEWNFLERKAVDRETVAANKVKLREALRLLEQKKAVVVYDITTGAIKTISGGIRDGLFDNQFILGLKDDGQRFDIVKFLQPLHPSIFRAINELDQEQDEMTQRNDGAMKSSDVVGGVDFNANHLNFSTSSEEYIQFDFPDIGIAPANVTGVLPVILNVTPIHNLPMLLGMTREEDFEEITKL